MAITKQLDFTVTGDGQPMDLTRDEYVRFQQLMTEKSGPMALRHVLLVFSLLACASLALPEAMALLTNRGGSWLLLGMAGVAVLVVVVFWALMPVLIKRRAAQTYDRQLAAGHSYYGVGRVLDDRVEKEKADFTLSIRLDNTCLVVEDATMFVVMNNRRQAVILPARCVTSEQAAVLRQTAAGLMPGRYRVKTPLVPGGVAAVVPAAETRQVAFEEDIEYTVAEYLAVSKEVMNLHFWRRAPLLAVTSTLVALLVGMSYEEGLVPTVAVFLLLMGLNLLTQWWLPRRRLSKPGVGESIPSELRRLAVRLDDRGVSLTSDTQGQVAVPWSAIRHVYDAPPFVKFVGKGQLFFLPQRYIHDIAVFSTDMDHFREQSV